MSFHELMLMNALFKLLENTNIYISILIGLVSLMYYDKKFINLNYCSNFFKKKITKISFVAEDKTASSRFRALMFYISKNCKVDELLESVKSNNYNDFLQKINKVKSLDEYDSQTNSSELTSDINSKSESIDSLDGLSETMSISETNSKSQSDSETKETNQEENKQEEKKTLNNLVSIEKIKPEPGDEESSEVIIHINHDKK